jgi:hypothetical protein
MDLVDLIEKRRFVGREFLVWMWFESELCDGLLGVEGFGTCEIRLEGQITLVQEKEQSRLKGAQPSGEPEAHEALRQGKLPTQARVRVSAGELEYAFLFGADTLALSAIKIPNVVKEEGDEQFYERMYLVEELEALFAALYGQFLALRLSTAWDEQVLPAIRAWVRGDELIHPDVYRKMRARVAPLGSTRRPATVPPPAEAMEMEEPALKIA